MSKGILGALVLALAIGCVDVEGGESGTYVSPCGAYGGLLLCGRENGGADPEGNPGSGAPGGGGEPTSATCADACQVAAGCFPGEIDVAECTAECQAQPPEQALLDCIVDAGCSYPEVCLGVTQ